MQDFEYVTEPTPGDITPDRLARRAASGMSKFFGVVASSMAVAGGLFVGNVLTTPADGLTGPEGPVGVDGAFADAPADAATGNGTAGNGSGSSAGVNNSGSAISGFLPAGSSFSKAAATATAKPGAAALPGLVPVKGVTFGSATTASPAWSAAAGGTTTGTTTSATTTTTTGGTTGGTTTSSTTTASGGSTGGKDDGDDGKDEDKEDGSDD